MKFCLLSVLSLASSATAFSVARTSLGRPTSSLRSTPTEDDIAALRAAAAKAREEASKLSSELGKNVEMTATVPKKSFDEFKQMLPTLIKESDAGKQAEQWNDLKASKTISLFGQANLRTFPVSLSMLEQRTGLTPETIGLQSTAMDLDDFKYATLWVLGGCSIGGVASLALLPENIGATLCYLFAIVPILFLGIGSTAPEFIASAIANLKGTAPDVVPVEDRICRHEAAHFVCGYLCGLPITGYSVSDGVARVEFGVNNQKLSATEVAALSVTALSGLVAEAMEFKNAEGAQQDLLQLENVFRQSADFIGAADQQDLTRWGAFTAAQLLKTNQERYEKVVEAFKKQASVEECICLMES
eukprot:scaffold609_cov170-Amphora_coffeaeformis.AAC.19